MFSNMKTHVSTNKKYHVLSPCNRQSYKKSMKTSYFLPSI
jgi:hypothetical protein